ncbi:winged helix-turn-helix domain-containing protein [Planosporangium sp. 12N6]|uniref:winged helix-turn-helix domain-containing protein n=1 Tax=Planosporangium spinosum TaxID=3402278 RepID=UPI003CF65DCC
MTRAYGGAASRRAADVPAGPDVPAGDVDPEPSTLVVNVQIAVPRGTPSAERVFALADRLHAFAVGDDAAARVSTTVALVVDETAPGVDPDLPPAAPQRPIPDLVLLVDRRIALLEGRTMRLTRLEYDLLCYLADNAGRVLTRGQLMRQVWGYPVGVAGRTVDVHIRRLRAKLGGRGPAISTVRGVGYRLDRLNRVAVVRAATGARTG